MKHLMKFEGFLNSKGNQTEKRIEKTVTIENSNFIAEKIEGTDYWNVWDGESKGMYEKPITMLFETPEGIIFSIQKLDGNWGKEKVSSVEEALQYLQNLKQQLT